MIMLISWIQFQQHYMKTDKFVYVRETPETWDLFTCDNMIVLKTIVNKTDDDAKNYAFVDRHLNNMNIIKVDGVIESNPVKLRLVQE